MDEIKEETQDESCKIEIDSDYVPMNTSSNSLKLELSTEIADRYQLSDRAFGAITSAVLTDVGMVNSSNNDLIVDKNKARRSRLRKSCYEESKMCFNGLAIFFDGRKDETMKLLEVNDNCFLFIIFYFTFTVILIYLF